MSQNDEIALLDSKGNLVRTATRAQDESNITRHKQALVYARPLTALEHTNVPFAADLMNHADFAAIKPFVIGGNVADDLEFIVFVGDAPQHAGFPRGAELLRQAHFVLFDIVTELTDMKDKIHSARNNSPAACDEKVFKAIATATKQSVEDVKALFKEKRELVKRGV